MQQWFDVDGERHLLEAESVEDPGDRMEQVLNSFTGFLIEANVSFPSCPGSTPALMNLYFVKVDFFFRTGPAAPRHDLGDGGRATPAAWAVPPRDGDVRGPRVLLQTGPGGLSLSGRGVWQGAAGHGQRV